MSFFHYYHSIRHLRLCQIYGRLSRPFRVPRPSTVAPPARRRIAGNWTDPARREPRMIGPLKFRFLNEVRDLDRRESWNDHGARKLWLYNLHYFDDLNALDFWTRREWHEALIRRWVEENPPTAGNGWEPYPTSLRIVNWIKYALAGGLLPEYAVHSLAIQSRCLEKTLETHLLGNHLFANAKALIFAGLFFEGKEADRWLAKGVSLLRQEVPVQVLTDGGHFERSPMYHSQICEDLLDLLNLARTYGGKPGSPVCLPLDVWQETAGRMLSWLAAMCHPDGEIALFSDAAFGIASSPVELGAYAYRLGINVAYPRDGVTHLRESGYVRLQAGEAVLLLDVGPIGPDYLPAHGHADILSFELSLYGRRVIVDTGTFSYEEGPVRMYQRGTSAHNTVIVDNEDSSEVWGSFRVARRAKPIGLHVEERENGITVQCSHDGYCRLPGRVIHGRRWEFKENRLTIVDSLVGHFRAAQCRFLLHPEVDLSLEGREVFLHPYSSGQWQVSKFGKIRWEVEWGMGRYEKAVYFPRFGDTKEAVRLVTDIPGNRSCFRLIWS